MTQRPKLSDSFIGDIESAAPGTNTFNPSIKEVDRRREVLNRRLDEIEKRYRAQFSALESVLGKLRNTNDYLRQKLAAFPAALRG